MPFNALVNIGYVVVAVYWLRRLSRDHHNDILSMSYDNDSANSGALRLSCDYRHQLLQLTALTLIYGPVQFGRIVTQDRPFALWDQWQTLPFFGVVIFTMCHIHGIIHSIRWSFAAPVLSTLSYTFALIPSGMGFDYVLAVHMIATLGTCVMLFRRSLVRRQRRVFFAGVAACLGFVILKVTDHWLAAHTPRWFGFHVLTGHFWSKVCDFLQIHFVLLFAQNEIDDTLLPSTLAPPAIPATCMSTHSHIPRQRIRNSASSFFMRKHVHL